MLRVNPLGSPELDKDLELAKKLSFDALLFPYIETAEQVKQAGKLVQQINPALTFMINIQTPLGVLNAQEICASCPSLRCIIIGTNTLANQMQINITKSAGVLSSYLSQVALAARAYGKVVIDGPHYNVSDEFSCEASTKLSHELGFDGKALVHPIQIEYINDIFTPKKVEVEKAIQLLDAYENSQKSGKKEFLLDGELIDNYQVKWAQRTITLYDKYKELGQTDFV